MQKKTEILIGILVIGIILISGFWILNEYFKPVPISGTPFLPKIPVVIITTDKTEYEQGEIMETVVRNNLDKSIQYNSGPSFGGCANAFSIGVKENGVEQFYASESFDCVLPSLELKPKSEQIFDLKLDKHFNEWFEVHDIKFPAICKLEFNYYFAEENSKGKAIYSNEFTIKEREIIF